MRGGVKDSAITLRGNPEIVGPRPQSLAVLPPRIAFRLANAGDEMPAPDVMAYGCSKLSYELQEEGRFGKVQAFADTWARLDRDAAVGGLKTGCENGLMATGKADPRYSSRLGAALGVESLLFLEIVEFKVGSLQQGKGTAYLAPKLLCRAYWVRARDGFLLASLNINYDRLPAYIVSGVEKNSVNTADEILYRSLRQLAGMLP